VQNSRSIPQFRNQELREDNNNRHLQRDETKYTPPKRPELLGQRMQIAKSVLPSSSEPFVSDSPDKIKLGMFVEHERFGRGKVLNIEGKMPDLKAKVFFPNTGEKNLLLKFAKLKISDQTE